MHTKKCGCTFFKSRSMQLLTKANKHRCFAWAKSHLTWNFSQWKRVLWTVEIIFRFRNVGRKIIRKKDETNDHSCYNHVISNPSCVMMQVWTTANMDGNLHFCSDIINVHHYIRIFNMNLQPSVQRLFGRKRYLFQQDNPQPFIGKLTRTWLMSKHVLNLR